MLGSKPSWPPASPRRKIRKEVCAFRLVAGLELRVIPGMNGPVPPSESLEGLTPAWYPNLIPSGAVRGHV